MLENVFANRMKSYLEEQLANIYDVAKKSGYSTSTVSKALNGYRDVGEDAKKKIIEVARELGYMPNSSARTLPSKKSWTIGVLFSEQLNMGITHPFFSYVIESFKQVVEENGYDLLFIAREIGDNIYSYLEHCRYRNVDGVIVVHSDFPEPEIKELVDSDIPVVFIDKIENSNLTVTSENTSGVKLAIDHLVSLGHRKIAHIKGNEDSYATQIRKKAFLEAMSQNNLSVPKEYLVSGGYFSLEGGYEAMNELLSLDNPPTAVFAAGDYMAFGAIRAINDAGYSVPEDISVIGFDDVEAASLISPGLTTIRQDTMEMGRRAAKILIDRIRGNKEKLIESIPVSFVERGSTAKIK